MTKAQDDRRQHPRIDARIEVQFQSGPEFVHCYTQNISRGGIYIESEMLPDPNAKIELILDLSETGSSEDIPKITLLGRVVRLMSEANDGKTLHKIGIQFIEISPHIQMKLDRYCDELEKSAS